MGPTYLELEPGTRGISLCLSLADTLPYEERIVVNSGPHGYSHFRICRPPFANGSTARGGTGDIFTPQGRAGAGVTTHVYDTRRTTNEHPLCSCVETVDQYMERDRTLHSFSEMVERHQRLAAGRGTSSHYKPCQSNDVGGPTLLGQVFAECVTLSNCANVVNALQLRHLTEPANPITRFNPKFAKILGHQIEQVYPRHLAENQDTWMVGRGKNKLEKIRKSLAEDIIRPDKVKNVLKMEKYRSLFNGRAKPAKKGRGIQFTVNEATAYVHANEYDAFSSSLAEASQMMYEIDGLMVEAI